MNEHEMLAESFEANRAHLRAVAYRMLGSTSEAVAIHDAGVDPEYEAVMADALGPALVVVLDALAPAERLAFVLHDLFGVPFDEIAPVVGRSPAATRQLASRARRRVQGADDAIAGPDHARQREIVDAFLAASRGGDLDALVALLDPDVVLRADAKAVETGAPTELRGAAAVAGTFAGRAKSAQLALVDGTPGLVWAQGGEVRVVFALTFTPEQITEVEIIADPASLAELDVTIL